jgi:glucose-6-phosphate isomerase
MAFSLDFAWMTEPAVPCGVAAAEWPVLAGRYGQAHAAVAAIAATGVYGYRELEAQAAERSRVIAFAASVRGQYDDVVVLGIGGSSLGAMALRTALLPAAWNVRNAVRDFTCSTTWIHARLPRCSRSCRCRARCSW